MKILFAADILGSTAAFRRFLTAVESFRADAAVVLGDLTGTTLVPMVQEGPSDWQTTIHDRVVRAGSQAELAAMRAELERRGHYWVDVSAEEFEQTRQQPALVDLLFKGAVRKRMETWLQMADEAIGNSSLQLFMSPGCNDWRVIDDLLENGHKTQPCDGLVVPLEGYDMITAWSGATPAEDAVRTAREEDLVAQMEDLFQRARSARYVILNAHARPKSVQKLIKKLQPMLYVFSGGMGMGGLGGVSHIGRTVGLNPGVAASDDGNGSLRGALVELEHGQVKDYHHVSG